MNHRIGVCSWSLRPANPIDLVKKVRACGLEAVQLALDPIWREQWSETEATSALQSNGIEILSGMMTMRGEDYSTLESIRRTGGVRLDDNWPMNVAAADASAKLARRLGIRLITFHAGFLPHDLSDPLRAVMIDRLQQLAQLFAQHRLEIALETGQESAQTLVSVLKQIDHPSVSVNFDPANMILYGMGEPVEAFRTLSPWVKQVHIKDAEPAIIPGTWGVEMPVGRGRVDWNEFLRAVDELCPEIDLIIEREGGDHAIEDVRAAHEMILQSAHCL